VRDVKEAKLTTTEETEGRSIVLDEAVADKPYHSFTHQIPELPSVEGHSPLDLELHIRGHKFHLTPETRKTIVVAKTRCILQPHKVECRAQDIQHIQGATVVRPTELPVKLVKLFISRAFRSHREGKNAASLQHRFSLSRMSEGDTGGDS